MYCDYEDFDDDEYGLSEYGYDDEDDFPYDDTYDEAGFYAAFDLAEQNRKWFHCIECNGMGQGYYQDTCESCRGSGMRWKWLAFIKDLRWKFQCFLMLHAPRLTRCNGCGKLLAFGNHKDCLPF